MDNLQNLADVYEKYCRSNKNLDKKTLKAYSIDLKQFSTFITTAGQNVVYYDKNSIQAYIVLLHEKYKPKTVKRKIASLKAFFHYLEFEEIITLNPFTKIHVKLREPKVLPKTIPIQLIQSFLSTIYHENALAKTVYQKKSSLRDIAVSELLFATGVRISELCNLKCNDVDLCRGNLLIYGKGSKERMIQIGNEDVLKAVKNYALNYQEDMEVCGYFFVNRLGNRLSEQSVRFMINRYVGLASIHLHITPHMFRHSFATLLLEEDVDIRYIQKMLGHSSITTTQIYTHVSIEKQKDILTRKHPRNGLEVF